MGLQTFSTEITTEQLRFIWWGTLSILRSLKYNIDCFTVYIIQPPIAAVSAIDIWSISVIAASNPRILAS
jgi:hypothetical protein